MNFKQIRKRESYRRFSKFLTFAGPQKDTLATLMALHSCINNMHGYGNNKAAENGREAACVLFVDSLPITEVPRYINDPNDMIRETVAERLRAGR
jgi:hypothetical protein